MRMPEEAMDAAACIGCGACVAACKNSSAMLFVSAKVSHLAKLPQGRVEARTRARNMVAKMDELGSGDVPTPVPVKPNARNISILQHSQAE